MPSVKQTQIPGVEGTLDLLDKRIYEGETLPDTAEYTEGDLYIYTGATANIAPISILEVTTVTSPSQVRAGKTLYLADGTLITGTGNF